MDPISVSIIVPTYNRTASLRRLLASLNALERLQHGTLEVIVVDNGSTDGTRAFIDGLAKHTGAYVLSTLEQDEQGKSNAINKALANSRSDILMIVDDDVVVDSQLVLKHLECYKNTDFDAVQGRVLPGVDPTGRPADMSRLDEYNIPVVDYGKAYCEIRGLTGTNMSFKRAVLEKVGLFDPRLGPGASGFSEDTEFSMRISQAGFKIGYAPGAIVYHELNPQRYGSAYNREVQYRKGISRSLYRQDSLLFQVLPDLIANCFRYLVYAVTGRRQKVYKTEGRIAKNCGFIAGKVQEQLLRYKRL